MLLATTELTRTRPTKRERMARALEDPAVGLRSLGGFGLYEFVEFFFSEVSEDPFIPNWHIKYLCSELELIARRRVVRKPKLHDLIINIPPGSTKTITVSIMFPVWCWAELGHWMRFITAGYSAALSLEAAEMSRDLVRSDKFRSVYPQLSVKEDKDTKSNFKIIKKLQVSPGHIPRIQKGGNRYSTSVGGTLTGFHGDMLIVDDPIDPNRAASEVQLQNANHWMERTLSTRKTDKACTPIILVMQRLHQDDPTGHWLDKGGKVKHICIPGEIVNYRDKVCPQELIQYYSQDGLMDPKRLSWEVLQELESIYLGQYGYAGQVGQDPVPPGGGMFKVDRLTIIDQLPAEVNFVQKVRYWDKAASEDGGAYTVGCLMYKTTQNRFIVADIRRGQWSSEVREDIIRDTAEGDGVGVEVVVEQEPGSGGKESAENTVRNLAGYGVYVDRPSGDKVRRADPFSVQVNNGNVQLLRGDWNGKFIDELRFFPFGTYKDQVDASAGAFNRLTGKKIARRIT